MELEHRLLEDFSKGSHQTSTPMVSVVIEIHGNLFIIYFFGIYILQEL